MPERSLCPKLCKECPFRRTSPRGFLGECSGDPWEFLRAHFIEGELPLPCHMTVDWERADAQEQAMKAPVCRGFMTFLRNNKQMPKDKTMTDLYVRVPANHADVFSDLNEFMLHHHNNALQRGKYA